MENYVWLIVILLLSIIEVVTVNLFTVWFIISAVVALILSFFISNQVVLFAIFVLLGILLLCTTRPIVKKFMVQKKVPTNIDRVIGMIGVVTEDIKNSEIGEVKVDGKRWSAISDIEIMTGEKVVIKEISGVKLIVGKED